MFSLLKDQALQANILDSNGFAQMRYANGTLEVYQYGEWIDALAPHNYVTYGVEIDLTNSSPSSWGTWTDDAVELTEAAFNKAFPIQSYTFQNGQEVKALSKTDCTKYEDGTSADITSGTYDVMTKFTRGGYSISKDGNKLIVKITNKPNETGFCYKAFQRGPTELGKFYLGRYKGYIDESGKLRSLSGKTPTTDVGLEYTRNTAHANGSGYEQSGWYQLIWRQCLYMVRYRGQNPQSVIGQGLCGASGKANTGGSNGHGDTWGTSSNTQQAVLFGIEDFYGNLREWIDGFATDANFNVLTGTDNFNNDAVGYESYPTGITSNVSGWITNVVGDNHAGFISSAGGGSDSTYFCDLADVAASRLLAFGSGWNFGTAAGIFLVGIMYDSGSVAGDVGTRLMYLPTT